MNRKTMMQMQFGFPAKASGKDQWYRFQAKSEEETDLYIYDNIGWEWYGVEAKLFVQELNEIDTPRINLHINSMGGNVFDGTAIYNALKQHPADIYAFIEGIAASIASVIALAGDQVSMAANAFFMIHDPWICTCGNAEELRKDADVLDKTSVSIAKAYKNKTGKKETEIRDWMQEETWFNADEALEAGFIDEITDEVEAEDGKDLSVFENVPVVAAKLWGRKTGKVGNEKKELEQICRELGISQKQSKTIAAMVIGSGYAKQRDVVPADQRDADLESKKLLNNLETTNKEIHHARSSRND